MSRAARMQHGPGEIERRFHAEWLGMVQPEGLLVSIPVLLEAQCFLRNPPALQQRLRALAPQGTLADPWTLLHSILEIPAERFDRGKALPNALAHYHERASVVPTAGLRRTNVVATPKVDDLVPDTATDASRAGGAYELLVLEVPGSQAFDRPDDAEWSYPPVLKLERLLRDTRVETGVLLGPDSLRLVYAPHGQAAGWADFPIGAMVDPGGRPILDGLVMLLRGARIDDSEWPLRRLLAESRARQANVTNSLAKQVFEALQLLVEGFSTLDAAKPDGRAFEAALARGESHVYEGLLTVLLRMVFLLYAEDRSLLPADDTLYSENLSLTRLHAQLEEDRAAFPDTMSHRLGSWPRLLALFRTIYLGAKQSDLNIPARRGELFDPARFPFLEGRLDADGDATPPEISDDVVHHILDRLLRLDREKLSYRTLDVEQIGSVYERLMGYHVLRVDSDALCLRGDGCWVSANELLEKPSGERERFLVDERGLSKGDGKKVGPALKQAKKPEDVFAALDPVKKAGTQRVAVGSLVLQAGEERRRTSSHYTPRELSAPVVRRTLEPLLGAMGGAPTAERILELKVCDPAMGSGAFLVEACRFLSEQVVAAWSRDPACTESPDPLERLMKARRLVAQRCLYGVDKNRIAVGLGRLSLWLVTMAKDEPFTFVDHALKHGDSLVGLSIEQLRAFHWKPDAQAELFAKTIDDEVAHALSLRRKIMELAETGTDHVAVTEEKIALHREAEASLDRVRLIGDLCVGAWFAHDKDKDRLAERQRRLDAAVAWLGAGGPPPAHLSEMQDTMRAGSRGVAAFHWWAEFPEVFTAERADPLDHERVNRVAMMDAFVGNPPFMGGRTISGNLGEAYSQWLEAVHDASMNTDYSAHFFRRCDALLGPHGSFGLFATNTIAQGDTRRSGLQPIVEQCSVIYDAVRSLPWPGEAGVTVSIVCVAKGSVAALRGLRCVLDGQTVDMINSRLRAGVERPDPRPLSANKGRSFVGSYVLGMGFVLTPEEREELVTKHARNADRIFPYLGGEEINTSPTQSFDRYVINFGAMSLEEASDWPELLEIVRAKVKPERDRVNRDTHRKYWWHYGDKRPALYDALRSMGRCLVTSLHSKHLMFAWQPTDRIFSHGVAIFTFERDAEFGVQQSRVHESWARLLSSTMEDRLRYASSDCFDNFPFPRDEHLAPDSALESIGQSLYEARARLMVERNQGLTTTYNQLKDPNVQDVAIVELRGLHEDLDRAVLAAYGWSDLAVPPFVEPTASDEKRAFAAFEDAVLDRLFALNSERAAEEGQARGGSLPTLADKGDQHGGKILPFRPNLRPQPVPERAALPVSASFRGVPVWSPELLGRLRQKLDSPRRRSNGARRLPGRDSGSLRWLPYCGI